MNLDTRFEMSTYVVTESIWSTRFFTTPLRAINLPPLITPVAIKSMKLLPSTYPEASILMVSTIFHNSYGSFRAIGIAYIIMEYFES